MATRTQGPLIAEAIHTLRGANYFSWDPVVVLRLDLASYDEVFTQQIPGFNDRLRATVPSLIEHKCSEGVRGGFFMRCDSGTLLGHVTEHVALEIQSLAGIDVAFGKTRSTARQGVYNVVFRYEDEPVGIRAAELAYDLVNDCLTGELFDLTSAVEELRELRARQMDDHCRALMEEARHRDIPVRRMDRDQQIFISTGRHSRAFPYFGAAGLASESMGADAQHSVDFARDTLDSHFPPGRPTHAPLFAVAGSAGADLAARLLTRCLALDGKNVAQAVATSHQAASDLFAQSDQDAFVLEVSLSVIIHEGLPYHQSDTGIVLNSADHGPVSPDITAPEDLAYALAVTVEEVRTAGVAVLNADDPHVLEMAKRIYARPVFFTRNRDLRFLSEHITAGNLAIVLTEDRITLEQRREERLICRVADLPLLASLPLPDSDKAPPLPVWDAVLGTIAALAGNGWTPWAIREAMISAMAEER